MAASTVLTVLPLPDETGRPLARLDPDTLKALDAAVGDAVAVMGRRTTVARVQPMLQADWGRGAIQLDGVVRANAGTGEGEKVRVWRVAVTPAKSVTLRPLGWEAQALLSRRDNYLGMLLDGSVVMPGDRVRSIMPGNRWQEYLVEEVETEAPALITGGTLIRLQTGRDDPATAGVVRYGDVGGLAAELQKVRELIELPLRFPDLFKGLGIEPPKGVLLHGPPGAGKTLIARAVANENNAHFIYINGPEIMHKFYGQSEANLRTKFDEAKAMAPSILFLDEIDSIAPRRTHVLGDVEKRVVAQLLTLMDGLDRRGQVVVIGATNIPEAVDPALRRPGRFDREIEVGVPDRHGRLEILQIHSRRMPLAEDVDLAHLAEVTHGFVGADLAALCREAAMLAVRRNLPDLEARADATAALRVTTEDFHDALREVEPSALREVFTEVPDVDWDDVGGLDEAKRLLREAVELPLRHGPLYERMGVRPVRGILLVGPPGSGKTLLAKAMASRSGLQFLSASGPDLLSKWVGETEKALRAMFRRARAVAPCIVFFDAIDCLFPPRDLQSQRSRAVDQLLSELDGLEDLKGVLVIGATNRIDLIDPAALRPGRFDLIIHLPGPDRAGREEILRVHLRRKPLAADVDTAWLAVETEGFSGADLAALVSRAAQHAIREALDSSGEEEPAMAVICQRHFAAALAELHTHRELRQAAVPGQAAGH